MTKLNRDEKGQVVAAVVERLEATETIVAADFRGLTVAELAELRQKLREAEAEMTVVKNTLSRRAADQTGRSALLPYLEGPTGLVWVKGDAARAAKALSDFEKGHPGVFTIRGGVLGSDDLPAASIVTLASLPSRDQLLAQLAGGLAAPLSGLAGTLNGLIGALARTLAAVQGSGALAPGEAPAVSEAAPAAEAPGEASAPPEEPTDDVPVSEAPSEEPAASGDAEPTVPVDETPAAEDAAPVDAAPDPAPAGGDADTPES